MDPFNPISQWLQKNNMSGDEKRRMRTVLVHYATTHPVKSGIMSPYTFRYATMAFASLLIVLGGSVGLTTAANNALPTDSLYPVKIFIEEYRAKNQTTPDAIIAFETGRIKTRFNEATKLAVAHKLDDATSSVIQAGIEHSRDAVKSAAESIQDHNPELAVAASSNLETTFSSNGKILATIEQNTNQSLGTIVLAAQVTTEKLAMEKAKYEHMVALKPNDTTKIAAETKLAAIEKILPTAPTETESTPAAPVVTALLSEPAATIATKDAPDLSVPALKKLMIAADVATTVPVTTNTVATTEAAPAKPTAQKLVANAKEKMAAGNYSQALVILGQAEQIINEQNLTETLENTYKLDTTTQ